MKMITATSEKQRKILKLIGVYIGVAVGLWLLFMATKLWFLWGIYSFITALATKTIGLDQNFIRPIAVLLTVCTVLATPCVLAFLLYGGKKLQIAVIALLATSLYAAGTYYSTENVFFDRATGKAVKYYIRTMNGFKFSSKDDFDPVFGAKYQVITEEVIKEYRLWQQTGKLETPAQVRSGEYFNTVTGEPIVWYSTRPNGDVKLFPLPGYDPMTGDLLKPINKEIISRKVLVRSTPAQQSPSSFAEKQFINFIESGGNDISINTAVQWYMSCGIKVNSEAIHRKNYTDREYVFNLERIVFTPNHTVVGMLIKPNNSGAVFPTTAHLTDVYGELHKSERVIINGNVKEQNGQFEPYGDVRVLYVFPLLDRSKIKEGFFNEGIGYTEMIKFFIDK